MYERPFPFFPKILTQYIGTILGQAQADTYSLFRDNTDHITFFEFPIRNQVCQCVETRIFQICVMNNFDSNLRQQKLRRRKGKMSIKIE